MIKRKTKELTAEHKGRKRLCDAARYQTLTEAGNER